MASKREQILISAENMIRVGGYNAFSFRDIASEVGIKSASVHYHFPTKEDLGAAVASRYADNFFTNLGDPVVVASNGDNPLETFKNAYRHAMTQDQKMCLCALLGAEFAGLPGAVQLATREFFERAVQWLLAAFKAMNLDSNRRDALTLLATLQGAMILSTAFEDGEIMRTIVGEGVGG